MGFDFAVVIEVQLMSAKLVKEGFREAFNFFMQYFERNCRIATTGSWSGGKYYVELFEDGSYRTLWSGDIGNLYSSPGILLSIPPLTWDEWSDDHDLIFYENSREEMVKKFEEAISEVAS